MKLTEQDSQEIAEFAAWLDQKFNELPITKKQVALAVGLEPDTIRRYANGEIKKPPSREIQTAIKNYIMKYAEYHNFSYIEPERFAEILRSLQKEFDVSQQELAKYIDQTQKKISNYQWNVEKADAYTQYMILDYFYMKCLSFGTFHSQYYGTGVYLDYLLHGEKTLSKVLIDEWGVTMGQKGTPRKALRYMLKHPVWLQEFIMRHCQAFYDKFCVKLDDGFVEFHEIKNLMEHFRDLSEYQQQLIVEKLESKAHVGLPKEENEDDLFFYTVTEYRTVIYNDVKSRLPIYLRNDMKRNQKGEEFFIRSFETFADMKHLDDDEFIEEIEYKLTLTQYEWYVWMLFVIYDYKGYDLDWLRQQMSDFPD